jgi:hypothetical protein
MTNKILFLAAFFILTMTFSVKSQTTQNNSCDTNALKVAKKYLEDKFENVKAEGKNIATFKVVGTDKKNDTVIYYVWAYIIDYTCTSNKLQDYQGSSLPVKLTLLLKNKIYNVIKDEKPGDGEGNGEDMKRIFPPKVIKQINPFPNEERVKLKEQSIKEAKAYYKIK